MGGTNSGGVDIPPNTVKATQGFFVLRENGRIESFQPHMHLRGKAMSMEAILPTGQVAMLSHVGNFNFNWHNSYVYADDAAPLLPKGTIIKVTGVARQHDGEREQPGSERLGRLRRSHGRRDGACVGQRHLHGRRRTTRPKSRASGQASLREAARSNSSSKSRSGSFGPVMKADTTRSAARSRAAPLLSSAQSGESESS